LGMIKSNPSAPVHESELEMRWRLREDEWRRKLGRLRLGVESIEEQLARYRRVTWALSILPIVVGLMFVSLLTVFGSPLIGLTVAAILFVSIGLGAWLDYALLARRARCYLDELNAYVRLKEQQAGGALDTKTTSEPG
jgi:hypothetical protein